MITYDPCPWCDSTKIVIRGGHRSGYRAVCQVCKASGPVAHESLGIMGTGALDALKAWNNKWKETK